MKKQLFGQRSEKQRYIDDVQQPLFTEDAPAHDSEEAPGTTVAAHTRRKKKQRGDSVTDEGLRFDANVPVVDVEHSCAELDGPQAHDYEVVRYEGFKLARGSIGNWVAASIHLLNVLQSRFANRSFGASMQN